jgi:hypothetical protein
MSLLVPNETDKARENRLRRVVARQGLHLTKSRARAPQAPDFGTYMLTDPATNLPVASGQNGYGLSLDDVERALHQGDYPGVYRTDETTASGEAVYTTSRGGRFVSSKVAAIAAHFERRDRSAAIAAIMADLTVRELPADADDAERAQAYDRMSEVIREADQEVGIFVELAHLAATAISLLALERDCTPWSTYRRSRCGTRSSTRSTTRGAYIGPWGCCTADAVSAAAGSGARWSPGCDQRQQVSPIPTVRPRRRGSQPLALREWSASVEEESYDVARPPR